MKTNTRQTTSVPSDYRQNGSETAVPDPALAKFQLGYYSRVIAVQHGRKEYFCKLNLAIKSLAGFIRIDQFIDLQSAAERLAAMQPMLPPDTDDDQLQWFFRVVNDGMAVVSPRVHATLIQLADSAISTLACYDPWYTAGVRIGELQADAANDAARMADGENLSQCVRMLPQEVASLLSSTQDCVDLSVLVRHLETEIAKADLTSVQPNDESGPSTKAAHAGHREISAMRSEMKRAAPVDMPSELSTESERHISLEEARAIMPGYPSATSIWRWYSKGVKGVRLATICVAGRRYTTRDAIDRFIAATTAAADGAPTPTRSPTKRERAIGAAERELGVVR